MQVAILVGGKGTRLKPLTDDTPKPMVLVNGKPFLYYLVEYFKKKGVDDIIFLTGYMSEKIEDYFGDGSDFGIKIRYSVESKPLGTAGAIRNAYELLDDEFIVVNGDTLVEFDLQGFVENHKNKDNPISMLIIRKVGKRFGNIKVEKDIVSGFSEKENPTGFINAGIYLLNKSVLDKIEEDMFISIENDVFPKYVGKMTAFMTDGYFIDIGTIDTYEEFKKDILELEKRLL
ncbi:nucleoside-diphosphate-sugar pyrophosphorylase [Candidatus Woesearchaeota archaeon]|nr:MAG: nucleoside-diphosphate-sugar pyrophosphorylase [Candidatus Woesearchaeota archaeon]